MDSLSDVGNARLACFALSLLMMPLSLWFWLYAIYFKSTVQRNFAGIVTGVLGSGLIFAQIAVFREVANIEGRLNDFVLAIIVLAQSAAFVSVGHFRDSIRSRLGMTAS